jgi:hypothetical protein
MGQTFSPAPTPRLGDQARRAARLAKQVNLGDTYSKIILSVGGFVDADHVPSWSDLANFTGEDRATVRNAIRRAMREGILRVEHDGQVDQPRRVELTDPPQRSGGRRRR